MIVTGKELLSKAKAGKYAVPALNVDNLESVRYKSANGLTYVTLKMKEEKKPTIAIERE